MRAARSIVAVTIMALVGVGLSACGSDQSDELEDQLRKAGYTDVDAEADYDTTTSGSGKKSKSKKKLDDYEARAKAGTCTVEIEQDSGSRDYVVEIVAGNDVNFRNLSAGALVAEMAKQGVKC